MKPHRFPVVLGLAVLFCLLAPASIVGQQVTSDHAANMRDSQKLFKTHVRTTLRASCLKCHGGKTTEGDLDLSTRESLLDSGFVDLEDPEASHLLAVIRHEATPHMPKKATKLPQRSLDAIAKWVALGAAYDRPLDAKDGAESGRQITDDDRGFWSFRPLVKQAVPKVSDEWVRNDIDRFLRSAQLDAELVPNREADRGTLIRRATFDLTGLPPTRDEIQAFVNDDDPQAYEKLIDRLLDSPRFGERWARHWMDVARFAESHGYEQDYDRPNAYHYRDFLIRAINTDLPYDKFMSWQLAGDELEPDNPLAMMATGFMGAGVFPTQLTETEFESTRYDELDDIVATTGVAYLGLSIGCARCHDHKYDPIPTRDYYRFAAVFTKTIRSEIALENDPAKNNARREEHAREVAKLEAEVKGYTDNELENEFAKWLPTFDASKSGGVWQRSKIISLDSSGETKYQVAADGSILATGTAPDKEIIVLELLPRMPQITSIRLEALRHDSLPQGGPGRAPNGNFALGDFTVEAVDVKGVRTKLTLKNPRATHQQNTGALSIAGSIDDDPVSGWAVDVGGIGKDQAAVFDFDKPVEGAESLTVKMRFHHPNRQHSIGRFRVTLASASGLAPSTGDVGPPAAVLTAVAKVKAAGDDVDPADRKLVLEWFADNFSKIGELKRQLAEREANGPKIEKATVQVSSEGFPHMKHNADGRGYPHFYSETHQLSRGDVHQKGDVMQPGYLRVLMRNGKVESHWDAPRRDDWTRTSLTRAGLSRWLTDAEHGAGHLAARVAVNRLWQHHFGRGLVATPNDFGFQGERPTNPELLDYLAHDFVANGWKMKRIHRLIMTSAAYRQSTERTEPHQRLDPDNLLWARRIPRRLEAEAIRDSVLAVSGELDETMYGKGSLDSSMKRRSVYFFVKRSRLIPEMMLFDWPESLVSIGQRSTTTTAPQALLFMNSPLVRRAATAQATEAAEMTDAEFVEDVYERTLGRQPTKLETGKAAEFLAVQSAAHRESGVKDVALRSRADLCQVMFSLNEFVFVE
jgi:hypothetical protein